MRSPSKTLLGISPTTLTSQEMKRVETWIVVPRTSFTTDNEQGVFVLRFDDGTSEEVSFPLLGPSD